MSTTDLQSGGSDILQELEDSQRISASVSGALLRGEQPATSALDPQQIQHLVQAFGIQATHAAVAPQLGPWQASITFPGGVPVGGWANLTLFSNGTFNFSGHFHVSGAPSYNTGIVWLVKDGNGTAYQFTHSGRVHGTFESGSRDDNWNTSGTNPAITAGWNNLASNWSSRWEAKVNINLSSIVDDVKSGIGFVSSIVAVV